jgi:hypothetical protein
MSIELDLDDVAATSQKAQAELAALRADAERLAWIEQELMKHSVVNISAEQGSTSGRYAERYTGRVTLFAVSSQHVKAGSLRAAIDAARAGVSDES